MNVRKWALVALFIPLSTACATRGDDSDSETHFVCQADEECRSKLGDGYGCVASACKKVVPREAGVTEVPRVDASIDAPADTGVVFRPVPRPTDEAGCARVIFAGEWIAQNFYVLIDQSAGMSDPIPSGSRTWWQATVDGIEALLTSPVAAPSTAAFQYFPLGSAPDSCQAPYDQPAIEPARPSGDPSTIISAIQAHAPLGLSSPGPALKGGIDYMTARSAAPDAGVAEWKVILIVRGTPAECDPMTMAGMAAFAAAGAAASPHVYTYVVALGEGGAAFDEVAAAGGTNHAFSIVQGDVQQQLRDAFDIIKLGELTGAYCERTIPGALLAGNDPSLIQVFYELGDGGISYVTRVNGAGDCAGLDYDGYYLDDPLAPTKAILCPELCMHPRSLTPGVSYACR